MTIDKAAELIRSGDVVAFPTETVYGLGADATNEQACNKIYQLKSRPSYNPLIVHVATLQQAKEIGEFNELAELLARHFWPGPVTLVVPLKKYSGICSIVSAGLDKIGIRIPKNDIALSLIKESGKFIAAPSANISNYVSPTEASHVYDAFKDEVLIIDGGKATYGLESTIIDVSTNKPQLLRYGFITPESIEKILRCKISLLESNKIIAPGMMKKHYAPTTKLRLNATLVNSNELGIGFGEIELGEFNLSKCGDLTEAAANLYSMIRIMDYKAAFMKTEAIAIAPIPTNGIGLAINDRLSRASM